MWRMEHSNYKSEKSLSEAASQFCLESIYSLLYFNTLCEEVFLLCAEVQFTQNITVELYDTSQHYFTWFMKF